MMLFILDGPTDFISNYHRPGPASQGKGNGRAQPERRFPPRRSAALADLAHGQQIHLEPGIAGPMRLLERLDLRQLLQ